MNGVGCVSGLYFRRICALLEYADCRQRLTFSRNLCKFAEK